MLMHDSIYVYARHVIMSMYILHGYNSVAHASSSIRSSHFAFDRAIDAVYWIF